MGVYSKDIKDVKDLKEGDAIAVPNDPTNELRALKLFEKAGVLKVDPKATEKATAKDVIENPKIKDCRIRGISITNTTK